MTLMTKTLTPPLKWHGGKHDLASWIIGLMPARCANPNKPDPADNGWLHYVEPYFGGGSVLLANDPEGISEVVNDLNPELAGFWNCMMNPELFDVFKRHVEGAPFAKNLWKNAGDALERIDVTGVPRAAAFFVRCRQSLAGRMKNFAPVTRNRTRKGMNEQVSAWLNAVEGLPEVHTRLKRVLILNDDALAVIRKQDGPRTLFYLDPPYLQETRATTGEYQHEMSREGHAKLLDVLQTIKGRFLLSGYRSGMYDRAAAENGWRCHEKQINNHAAGGKTKRVMTECVWCNF